MLPELSSSSLLCEICDQMLGRVLVTDVDLLCNWGSVVTTPGTPPTCNTYQEIAAAS